MNHVTNVRKKAAASVFCAAAVLIALIFPANTYSQETPRGDSTDVRSATRQPQKTATPKSRSGGSKRATYYVPDHYATIQAAVDAAGSGDTIIVRPDTYNNGPWAGPIYISKSIDLRSEKGSAQTTIDAYRLDCAVFFDQVTEGGIYGFTITNGLYDSGGGIHVSGGNPVIADNIITGNEAANGNGGGISCAGGSTATIDGNTISNNSVTGSSVSYGGGGIYCTSNSTPVITNNTISSNWSVKDGGGVYCRENSNPQFSTNTISENEAQANGGGIYSYKSNASFVDNTITLNVATNDNGGGIFCYGKGSEEFENNIITQNSADEDGGGFYLDRSDKNTTITGNTIKLNTVKNDGGGICCYAASPTVSTNTIEDNTADWNGGGIACMSYSSPTINRNTIKSNDAHWGGGVDCDNWSDPTITNNLITNNVTDGHGGGIECRNGSAPTITNNTITKNTAPMFGGGIYCAAYPTITNTILWDNIATYPEIYVSSGTATVTFCDVEGGWSGNGNINTNPLFRDDVHLSAFSPCKQMGTNAAPELPSDDFDGDSRVMLFTVDIGADEYFYLFQPNWPGGFNTSYSSLQPNFFQPPLWYDDATTENLLGWSSGGDMCWMHQFGEPAGEGTIDEIHCIFGSAMYPGYCPGNGTPCEVFVWDDPTNDGDPSDCVLLTQEPTIVQNVDTDIYNIIVLTTPVYVVGEFYVGCCVSHNGGEYVAPMDQTTPYIAGNAWFCGTNTLGGFDPNNLMNNQFPPEEMLAVGYNAYWCLRADGTYSVIDDLQRQRLK